MVSCLIWVQYLVLNVHEQAFQEKACGLQLSKLCIGHLLWEEHCVFPIMSEALDQSLHNYL